MPILIPKRKLLTFTTKEINISIIDANAYYVIYKLKKAQIFFVFMRNLEYPAKKKDLIRN